MYACLINPSLQAHKNKSLNNSRKDGYNQRKPGIYSL